MSAPVVSLGPNMNSPDWPPDPISRPSSSLPTLDSSQQGRECLVGMCEHPHALAPEEVTQRLGVDPAQGLTHEQAAHRLRHVGANELAEPHPEPTWKRFLRQFRELVVLILLAATTIAALMQEWTDAVAIVLLVLLNALLGFLQEERAERALQALRKLAAPVARVRRQGHLLTVPARELVPGDILLLEAGDQVCADARLLSGFSLRTQEAALTGESMPVSKAARWIGQPTTPLADRRNMVFMGTQWCSEKRKRSSRPPGCEPN